MSSNSYKWSESYGVYLHLTEGLEREIEKNTVKSGSSKKKKKISYFTPVTDKEVMYFFLGCADKNC